VAGSATAAVVAETKWVSPALIALSVLLLGRSFYVIYIQKRGSFAVVVITWLSATFVCGFWTWWYIWPMVRPYLLGE
jgi:hypothetical protein